MRNLKVAAVQIRCEPLRTKENLARAERFVEQAVSQGDELVLLPELMPGGYILTEDIWSTAEKFDGPSVAWLKRTANRFGIYLGMSYAEAEGSDFYNSLVLATPEGNIAGRVRKSPPASVEAYFFCAGEDAHYIDTEIGRIGVGICYENLLYERMAALHEASFDIVLHPTAAGTPTPTFPIRRKDSEAFNFMLKGSTAFYAQALGVPIVMANKWGPLVSPLPGTFPAQNTSFPGLSAIADSDGTLKVQLGSEEGIAIVQVSLDPTRKVEQPPKSYRRWALPVPWYAFLWPLTQKLGERAYARCTSRSERALAVAHARS